MAYGRVTARYCSGVFEDKVRELGSSRQTGSKCWPRGAKYSGEWLRSQWHGHGDVTYPDHSRYEGEFKNNKRNGAGTMWYVDGRKYVGQFCDGMRHGKGKETLANGSYYEGDFVRNAADGCMLSVVSDSVHVCRRGVCVYANGSRYSGDFKRGLRDGHGVFEYKDGCCYFGGWSKGKREGFGVTFDKHGQQTSMGVFSNNALQSSSLHEPDSLFERLDDWMLAFHQSLN